MKNKTTNNSLKILMEDIKEKCSEMNGEGPNPTLRHIGSRITDGFSCLPLMALNKGQTTFGRHPHNDFFLDSSTFKNFISRWHCRIESCQLADGTSSYRLFDGSLNGTFVNDYRVSKEGCILNNGDKVIFGHLNGSNITEGNFAQQPESVFQYVFQNGKNLSPHSPKDNKYKYIWSSPCCKTGKKCSSVHKKKKRTKYCSPEREKVTSSGNVSVDENAATKDQFPPAENCEDKTKDSSVDRSSPIQTRHQRKLSMQPALDSGYINDCDNSDSSENSDVYLLDRVKLSVESFGGSDSDVFDCSDSPS